MFHCKLTFSIINTLKNSLKKEKDKLKLFSNQNVIYEILCDDCKASYIGQIKKNSTRMCEHISDINKKTDSPSVTSDYRINVNSNFRWNEDFR